MPLTQDDESDDEIFIGKLTLKEIKKHVSLDTSHCKYSLLPTKLEYDNSINIIETHSAPNIISTLHSPTPSPNMKSMSNPNISGCMSESDKLPRTDAADDSFLELERMVTDLHVSQNLDNTLDVIEYILNNPPTKEYETNSLNQVLKSSTDEFKCDVKEELILKTETVLTDKIPLIAVSNSNYTDCKNIDIILPEVNCKTPYKPILNSGCKNFEETTKIVDGDIHKSGTPFSNLGTPVFKTPKAPISQKKLPTSCKKTPSRSNTYQHITSPIASYIKNCPQVPLLKDVRPKKPLPGPSSIPKLLKNTSDKKSDKENIALPSVAYKNAKKTKLINLPDNEKLPKSQWTKKITSSLPKALVLKHDHRENACGKPQVSHQEDSFANLTLHQADVSVCTQKSAFKKL